MGCFSSIISLQLSFTSPLPRLNVERSRSSHGCNIRVHIYELVIFRSLPLAFIWPFMSDQFCGRFSSNEMLYVVHLLALAIFYEPDRIAPDDRIKSIGRDN